MAELLEFLLLNAAACTVLAMAVWLMGLVPAVRRRPALRYGLWMIVLVKLVTPPIVELRLVPSWRHWTQTTRSHPVATPSIDQPIEFVTSTTATDISSPAAVMDLPVHDETEASTPEFDGKPWLLAGHVAGSLIILAFSLRQVRRLRRALRLEDSDDPRLTQIVHQAAGMMGLSARTRVTLVNASVSPLMLVGRGGLLIVLPRGLVDDLSDEQLLCVVCHEMAHYLRRDHWGNTASWLVAVLFWWHPVVWWVRRELRTTQEACCDALVISRSVASRQSYAKTLFQALEFLQSRSAPLPALASGFGGKSSTQRRFEMIANPKVNHRLSWWNYLLLLAALAALPLWPALISAEEIALSDCPEAVQSTLQALQGAGQILKIERDVDGEEQFYEAEVAINGKVYDVRVSGQGTLLSTVYSRTAGEESAYANPTEAIAQFIEIPQATIEFVNPEARVLGELQMVDVVEGVITIEGYEIVEVDDTGVLGIQIAGSDERVVAEQNAEVTEQQLRAQIEELMAQLKLLEAQAARQQRQAEHLAAETQAQQEQQIEQLQAEYARAMEMLQRQMLGEQVAEQQQEQAQQEEAQRQVERATVLLQQQLLELEARAQRDAEATRLEQDVLRRISSGLPQPIQATLDREAAGASILQVTVAAAESGEITYTVQARYDTETGPRQYEIVINEQGELLHKRLQTETEASSFEAGQDGTEGRFHINVRPLNGAEAFGSITETSEAIIEFLEPSPEAAVETQQEQQVELFLLNEADGILQLETFGVPHEDAAELQNEVEAGEHLQDLRDAESSVDEAVDETLLEEPAGTLTAPEENAIEIEAVIETEEAPAAIPEETPAP